MLASINSSCATFAPATPTTSLLSIGEAASLTGLSVSHLRKLANRGAIPTFTTATGGHRRFKRESLAGFLGMEATAFNCGYAAEQEEAVCEGNGNKIALLARTSSDKQGKGWDTSNGCRKAGSDNESDLERQVKQLRDHAKVKYGTEGSLYSDIGSGLNYDRKNFVKLLEEICQGKWKGGTIIVTHKDRAMRYGWEMFDIVCTQHGVTLDVMDKQSDCSSDEEMAADVLSIITHYSAKRHGQRAAKNNSLNLTAEGLRRLGELRKAGYNIRHCAEQLKREGFFATNGRGEAKPITCWVIAKLLNADGGKVVDAYAGEAVEETKTSLEEWGNVHLDKSDSPSDKLSMKAIMKAYASWCASHGELPVSVVVVGHYLKQRGFQKYEVSGRVFRRYVKLV